jgi:hypothetical protein
LADDGDVAVSEPTLTTTAQSVTVASGVWVLDGMEHCGDLFGRPCTSSFPSPQCPAGTAAGQVCPSPGAFCFKTLTSAWVRIFQCQ